MVGKDVTNIAVPFNIKPHSIAHIVKQNIFYK